MELQDFFSVWDQLSPGQQRTLRDAARPRRAKAGDMVHGGVSECTGLLLVKSGQIRAYLSSEEGREITLYRLLERDVCLFSASCALRSVQFDISIRAERDTDFWVIPSEVFKGLMEESAPLANETNQIMASRFSEVMWLMDQILWKSLDRRLAAFLLQESALEGSDTLKITHEAIGNHMGTAREVVTRMLHYLQGEGLVARTRGTIELTDRPRLEELGRL